MKLLLTSAGIKNASVHDALRELLGKPIAESTALCIPTSSYGLSSGPFNARRFIAGLEPECPMTELGWKAVGNLELTALPSLGRDHWLPVVETADVLLVNGGDPLFLAHWMRESGLADLLPSLPAVYVGLSAGSMIMAPRIGQEFVGWRPPQGEDETLGFVDLAIFPHLDHPALPQNILPTAERWASKLGTLPAYAIDDETAIRVVDGTLDVISEGHWHQLNPR